MKHLSEEIIVTYIYGEATGEEIREVEQHLSTCSECSGKISTIRATMKSIDRKDNLPVPEMLCDKLAASFESREQNSAGSAPSEILTPVELAGFLRIPLDVIYELLPDIPYLTLAGQIRFRRSSVEKWLELREHNPVSLTHKEAQDTGVSPKFWRNVV
ncbi:MAG: zf-HC2 domain-containing protein [Candidatus Wallbacteria bacterium]|nr:zf-HC2 domain-containing protein [Candidatus Wallbacteria bacterium]